MDLTALLDSIERTPIEEAVGDCLPIDTAELLIRGGADPKPGRGRRELVLGSRDGVELGLMLPDLEPRAVLGREVLVLPVPSLCRAFSFTGDAFEPCAWIGQRTAGETFIAPAGSTLLLTSERSCSIFPLERPAPCFFVREGEHFIHAGEQLALSVPDCFAAIDAALELARTCFDPSSEELADSLAHWAARGDLASAFMVWKYHVLPIAEASQQRASDRKLRAILATKAGPHRNAVEAAMEECRRRECLARCARLTRNPRLRLPIGLALLRPPAETALALLRGPPLIDTAVELIELASTAWVSAGVDLIDSLLTENDLTALPDLILPARRWGHGSDLGAMRSPSRGDVVLASLSRSPLFGPLLEWCRLDRAQAAEELA